MSQQLKELSLIWSRSEVACMPIEQFADLTGTPLEDVRVLFGAANALEGLTDRLEAAERERDELHKMLTATQDGAAEAINHSLQLQSDLKASSDNAMTWMKRALLAEKDIARRDAAALEPVAVVDIQRGRGDGKKFALCYTSAGHSLPDDVYNLYTAAQPIVLPPGWKLVPIEPTEDMVINGFESKPNEHFSELGVWDAFEAMSGCEQAAHKARLCYAAMLAAAPAPGL
ncbi:hypothetical protein [Erwinia rhapontici]|uniref:hypothetical protein n=1 Tax=Erwinia rhapontici TaxID=55212 RepID=UPI0013313580|nr:hypothetical protein [Erwinia rhapontici]MBP2157166.1 hypothetical protein [Erwinia rhapontici]